MQLSSSEDSSLIAPLLLGEIRRLKRKQKRLQRQCERHARYRGELEKKVRSLRHRLGTPKSMMWETWLLNTTLHLFPTAPSATTASSFPSDPPEPPPRKHLQRFIELPKAHVCGQVSGLQALLTDKEAAHEQDERAAWQRRRVRRKGTRTNARPN